MPSLYFISGCDGAGKTTASYTILPEMLGCREFVNADEIARGLSPFQPEKTAIEAGRLMLRRMDDLLKQNVDFAFETTLSGKSFANIIARSKRNGYFITLVFFWLDSPELAIERVKNRVKEGGHYISENIVRRRYYSGINNLFKIYIPLTDYWMIIDNSAAKPQLIAEGNNSKKIIIFHKEKFHLIKLQSNGK